MFVDLVHSDLFDLVADFLNQHGFNAFRLEENLFVDLPNGSSTLVFSGEMRSMSSFLLAHGFQFWLCPKLKSCIYEGLKWAIENYEGVM